MHPLLAVRLLPRTLSLCEIPSIFPPFSFSLSFSPSSLPPSFPGLLPVHNFWPPLPRWNEVGMCKIVPRYVLHHRVALLSARFIFFLLLSFVPPFSSLSLFYSSCSLVLVFFLFFFLFSSVFFSLFLYHFFYPSSWIPYIHFFSLNFLSLLHLLFFVILVFFHIISRIIFLPDLYLFLPLF